MTESTDRSLRLSDLVEEVVRTAAPQETALLPEVTAAWLAGDLGEPVRVGRWRGGRIGVGLDDGLLVTVVFPVLTAALSRMPAPGAERGRRRRWQRLRRHPRVDAPVARELPARADAVRAAVLAVGPVVGVSPRRCRLIADAAYAVLLRHRSGGGS
ncbi:hypothetical protein [Micromonospora rifamycinica]|uniref:Uncharacterized protein n=1 Tax=Micromonospora rifamycinica TaxID=291594 RepID=A0A109IK95_9ACTN|nr:hypothetical protein [Micromonospora rifamycinica]KWV32086.1 hypothetical protein AWV63_14145 [Micromonospora rifamycinica]SCG41904.1 hypothetical protein GA0070623_0835 [Micromonospora rifamycinica]